MPGFTLPSAPGGVHDGFELSPGSGNNVAFVAQVVGVRRCRARWQES